MLTFNNLKQFIIKDVNIAVSLPLYGAQNQFTIFVNLLYSWSDNRKILGGFVKNFASDSTIFLFIQVLVLMVFVPNKFYGTCIARVSLIFLKLF